MRTPGGAPAAPTPPPLPPAQTLKRPVLKTCDYEAELNDYTHSDLLYDYSIVEAWYDPFFSSNGLILEIQNFGNPSMNDALQ